MRDEVTFDRPRRWGRCFFENFCNHRDRNIGALPNEELGGESGARASICMNVNGRWIPARIFEIFGLRLSIDNGETYGNMPGSAPHSYSNPGSAAGSPAFSNSAATVFASAT